MPLIIAVRLIVPAKVASAIMPVATWPVQLVPSANSISSLSTEMSTRYVPASRLPEAVQPPSASVALGAEQWCLTSHPSPWVSLADRARDAFAVGRDR